MSPGRAVILSSHPGPTLVVTGITVLLAVARGLPATTVAILGGVLLLNQLSVGLSNDAIDAPRDTAVGRRDKPVAAGALARRTAAILAAVAALAAVALSLALGPWAAALHAVALVSAWAYNAGLKATVLSPLPFLVSFGLLPSIVTAAAPDPAFSGAALTIAAALLGAAAHIANVLPDLETDAATGVRGLIHRLPIRVALVLPWPILLGAAVALAVAIGAGSPVAVVGLAVASAAAVAGVVLVVRGRRGRVLFRLVMAAALVDVALLVAGAAA